MTGTVLRSRSTRAAITVLALTISGPRPGVAQTIPPVFERFELANDALFGGRFNHSIQGFFDFELKGIFGTPSVQVAFQQGFPAINRGFGQFAKEARASVDQVPIPSGSVSVAYTFDPKLETFVRWERPFAPALSLNARTDGRGVLTLGAGYSYLDYKKFEGQDRDNVVFSTPAGLFDNQGRELVDETLFDFRLRQNIFTVAISYGVLDNFDVGVLIPVFDQSFRGSVIDRFFLHDRGKGNFQPVTLTIGQNGTVSAQSTGQPAVSRIDHSAFDAPAGSAPLPGFVFHDDTSGIGDLVLRSKAFFGSSGLLDFGGAFNIAVPTGDEDNLLGVGSVRLDPRLLISSSTERYAVHTNQGVHIDVDDSDRDRYDYSVGGEVLVAPWISLLVDQVGRIEFSGSDQIQKFDIVPGIKVNPYGNVVVGFNAIVPLNDAGLRTDFTPNVSAEVSMVF